MIIVRKIDDKNIGITDTKRSELEGKFTAEFSSHASTTGVYLFSKTHNISYFGTFDEFRINETTPASSEEALTLLSAFVGNFKPAGGSAGTTLLNYVKWTDQVEARTLYLDTNATPKASVENGIFNPFTSWAALADSPLYGNNINIIVAPGSDMSNEDVTIDSISNVIISAQSTPDATVAKIGNLLITGTSENIAISGIDITGNLTLSSSGSDISFVNSFIQGNINANPTSMSDAEPLRAWYHCTIEGDIALSGSGNALYFFENCWASEGDGHKPVCTINNPNGRLQVVGCEGFNINRLQGNVLIDKDSILYGYHSENTSGENLLLSGRCIDPDTNELAPIVCLGTAKISVGNFTYKRTGSTRSGVWLDGGIGTEQVRSNVDFINIIASLVNSDGSQRTTANTVKDIFAGIDDKLGELSALVSGANFTIQDSPDGTKIQFISNADQSLIYEFMKPQAIQGSTSISVAGGIASVLLGENSPVTQAISDALINYVQKVDGMQLTPEQFTTEEKSKLSAQSTITSISSDLSLVGGLLSLATAQKVSWGDEIN